MSLHLETWISSESVGLPAGTEVLTPFTILQTSQYGNKDNHLTEAPVATRMLEKVATSSG